MQIQGKWTIPDLDNEEFFGTLVKKDNRIKLRIMGILPDFKGWVRFPVIQGRTIEGLFTLIDCTAYCSFFHNYSHNNNSEISETTISCSSIIKYHCFSNPEELKFNKFRFNFDGLKNWIKSNKHLNKKFNYTGIKLDYKDPDPILFDISNDIKGKIFVDAYPMGPTNESIYSIFQDAYVEFSSSNPMQLEELLRLRRIISQFFMFALNYKIEPYIQRIFSNEVKNEKQNSLELIYLDAHDSKTNMFPREHTIPFTYQKVEQDFNTIFSNWLKIQPELEPVTNLFNIFQNKNLNAENKFLFVCQALEAFHSRFIQKNESYSRKEVNQYKNKETGEAIKTPKFKTRINRLINSFRNNIIQLDDYFSQEDADNLPNIITNTRDYYTHHIKSLEEKRLEITDLYSLTPKLIILLHSLILKEIGITNGVIKEYITSSKIASFIEIKKIPTPDQIRNRKNRQRNRPDGLCALRLNGGGDSDC